MASLSFEGCVNGIGLRGGKIGTARAINGHHSSRHMAMATVVIMVHGMMAPSMDLQRWIIFVYRIMPVRVSVGLMCVFAPRKVSKHKMMMTVMVMTLFVIVFITSSLCRRSVMRPALSTSAPSRTLLSSGLGLLIPLRTLHLGHISSLMLAWCKEGTVSQVLSY